MDRLSTIDSDLFLFLNSLHVGWMDKAMIVATDMWIWLPLYLLLIYWTVKEYGKCCWLVFLALGILVLCTDQLSAHVCKPYFQRLRPCYNIDFQEIIYLPKGMAGGKYGFVSSHATNTFGIAAFLTPVFRKYRPWPAILLILWAFVSSYSRIYLGFHYPGDIVCGALLGIVIGLIFWKGFSWFSSKSPKIRTTSQE